MSITAQDLEKLFPDDVCQFELDREIDRLTGHIISKKFEGSSVSKRQAEVWSIIREAFGEESQKVSIVFTFTPDEWKEIHDHSESA